MDFDFNGENLSLSTGEYEDGCPAVMVVGEDGGPWAKLSTHIPGPSCELASDGVFYLKEWTENALISGAVIDAGLIEHVPDAPEAEAGFVRARPFRLTEGR